MSIRAKIVFAFLLMAAALAVQSLVGYQNHARLREMVDLAIHKNYNALAGLNELTDDVHKLRRYEKEYFIYLHDPAKREKYLRDWEGTFKDAQTDLAKMVSSRDEVYSGEDTLMFSDWKEAFQFYGSEFTKIVEEYKSVGRAGQVADPAAEGLTAAANERIQEGKTRLNAALEDITRMGQTKTQESLALIARVEAGFQSAVTISLSLTALGIALAAALIFIVPGAIDQTLRRLLADADRISRDDLSVPVERSPVPEFDSLAKSLEAIRMSKLVASQRRRNLRADTHS